MRLRQLTVILLGTVGAFAWQSAHAADLISPTPIEDQGALPAVSGVNGNFELDLGLMNNPAGGLARAGGSLDIPVGDRFGVQLDGAGFLTPGGPVGSGAIHVFTRDPSRYLLGVTAGVVVAPGANLDGIGVEGELYFDRVSLEGWAGVAALDYTGTIAKPDLTGFFGFGDVVFYPDDNLRLALGGSDILGDLALHTGAEYMVHGLGLPLSVTADARWHSNGSFTATVGLKGYFGGSDDGKSLIDRQRQDDPPNRAFDFYAAAAGIITPPDTVDPSDFDNSTDCENAGFFWYGPSDQESCHADPPS